MTPDRHAAIPTEPPPGWEREVPKYRVSRDIQPAPKARFRSEPPFATVFDSDVWQYGAQPIKSGETIETKEWPHPSFHPLNYSAVKVLEFFNRQMKSRMTRSPWIGDSLRLDNGLSGPGEVHFVPPQLQTVNLRPQ